MVKMVQTNPGLFFALKFLMLFVLFYGLFFLVIGLSSPENFYSPVVAKYLDIVSAIKKSLVMGTRWLAGIAGYETVETAGYVIRFPAGRGVVIARDCVGIGVFSFWIAFVLASSLSPLRSSLWLGGGLLALWCINVLRITLLLIVYNKYGLTKIAGLDHHSFFNILAYAFIGGMLYLYYRKA